MITAIDTNILFDILLPNENFFETSARALGDSLVVGSVVVCDMVYAELCTHFAHASRLKENAMSSLRTVRFASMRLTEKLDFWPVALGAPIASREANGRKFCLISLLELTRDCKRLA